MSFSKIFNKKTATKKELRKLACKLGYTYGVKKLRFSHKSKHIDGSYNYESRNIYVNGRLLKKRFLIAFFHELAHHVASVHQHKWLTYHNDASTPLLSPRAKFLIENKIDRLAKKLWFKYVNIKQWGHYSYGYPKVQQKYITEWIKDYYN
jgi:hypothetical protein